MKLCLGCMSQYDDNKIVCPICGYEEGAAPENALHIRPGTILKERYVVGKAIGYGGFGVTYIGWDALLQTKIAIKEYLPSEFSTRVVGQTQVTVFSGDKQEQFADGKDKFIEEARKLAKFHSLPGIVKIFDSFEENNTAYIIMELLEGETLADLLKRENKLSYERAIEMMTPVLESLSEVHRQGIIHRDIAPDNIFVTKNGDVKLIDFGAARYATTTHSRSLTVIIKPGYSPEEQYRSRGDQGTHTDVYASVATIYRMITGITPPDALERRAYYENRQKDLLEPVSKFCKEISADREAAIMNALNIRVEDRTADMDSFLNELNSESAVTRKAGKIAKTDRLKWPLWAKIAIPLASAALITFTVLFATGIIGFKANIIKDIVIPEGQTRVPSVVSEEYKEGEISLSEAKLLMEVKGSVSSDKLDADLILSQDVTGGSIVQENTVVGVYISEGIRKQIVPNVIGMELEEAKAQLEAVGFSVVVDEQYDDTIAEGYIISQDLEPLDEAADGAEITLVVSRGRDPSKTYEEREVTLPNFIGMKYSDVITEAKKLGLTVKVVEKRYSKGYDKDTVMEQSPEAETEIKNSDVVEIVVSLGYGKVEVPRVLFMDEESAIAQIKGRGLRESVSYESSETVAAGNVISQSPDEGAEVDPESVVEIVVSTGPTAFAMPDVVGMSEADAKSTLNGKGLSVSVNYEQDDSKTEGEVIMQSIGAGSDVHRGDSVIITVCTHSGIITVPYVVGMSQSDAEREIKNSDLKANVVGVYSSTIANGTVISQSPVAGSGLFKNDLVTINVSLGSDSNVGDDPVVPDDPEPTTPVFEPDEPVSIKFSSNTLTMTDGEREQLQFYADSSKWTMTLSQEWKSSDSSVVSVDGSGNLTAKKAGTATITVNATGRNASGKNVTASDSCKVTVKAIVVPTKIELSYSDLTLEIYDTRYLSATVSPSDAVDKSVTWTSSNSSVVTVDNGFIEAIDDGTATITAKTVNGKTATCTVTVKPIVPSSVSINSYSEVLTAGTTKQLSATIYPNTVKDKSVTWSSSDPSVATVSSSGLVTAKSEGTAEIIATASNGKNNSCTTTVRPPSVKLSRTYDSLYIGDTLSLSATTDPSGKTVKWSTSNSAVATVSNGKVTAVKEGDATITASIEYDGKTYSATCSIYVSSPGVSLSRSKETIAIDESTSLTAYTTPSGQTVSWSSSNTSVATVNNGTVTGNGIGTCTITATITYAGKSYSSTCSITVNPGDIYVSPTSKAVYIGDTTTITATTSPHGKAVSWSSSNTSVATVSNGTVTAKSAGSATITASFTYGGITYKDTCTITVNTPRASLNYTSKSMYIGDTLDLSATTYPSGKTVSWSSSNSSVASVSSTGTITAKGAGSATVTASFTQGGNTYKATCAVTVSKPSVSLKSHEGSIAYGREGTLSYETVPSNLIVTWKSSDTSLATVNSDGVVSIKNKTGKVTITVQMNYNGYTYSDSCTLNVIEPYININSTSQTLYKGQSTTLSASTYPKDQTVSWKSSNTNVAKVSNGTITAQGNTGTATITASFTYGGKTYSKTCSVTVKSISIRLNETNDSFTIDAFDVGYDTNTGKFDYDYGYTGWSIDGASNDDIRWSIVSGPGYIDGWRIHITQPGTVRARATITKYGYSVTADYTVTLNMSWTVTGSNAYSTYGLFSTPGGSTSLAAVPYGTKVYFTATTPATKNGTLYMCGKTTYNGQTGWISFGRY